MTGVSVSVVDGAAFRAQVGETLLDAALHHHVDLPHDCRAGSCGTCRVQIVDGSVEGGETSEPGYVLACQCRLTNDITIAVEYVPHVETVGAYVKSLVFMSEDVVEVTLVPDHPFVYLPGQYCQFRFKGFPERAYSPTLALEGPADRETIRLHIRQVPGGRVSGALGEGILPGHKVRVTGPFGSAYLRPGKRERLVLASSGTGFAPIWAIAHAALTEMPDREIVVIPGARTRESLYMRACLLRLMAFPNVHVIPVVSQGPDDSVFQIGSPIDMVPQLSQDDLVYVCGSPAMVAAMAQIASNEGAPCYADAFEPSHAARSAGLLARARRVMPFLSPI
ncbi:MAG: ferredoxin-NAD reductase [Hyphomicrobiales bacterium]|nr:ferredoxin-NAD reductase [Hyphomicrobiales bacterium]